MRCVCIYLVLSATDQAKAAREPREAGGGGRPGGGTPIQYLYGYVPPNGVVILKFLVKKGVSISGAFSRTGYNISNA